MQAGAWRLSHVPLGNRALTAEQGGQMAPLNFKVSHLHGYSPPSLSPFLALSLSHSLFPLTLSLKHTLY